jgi:hypothetical protein
MIYPQKKNIPLEWRVERLKKKGNQIQVAQVRITFPCLKRKKTVEKDVGKNICRLLSSNCESVKYYSQFNE